MRDELPAAAAGFIEYAEHYGWLTAYGRGEDNGGSPFVLVVVKHPDNGHAFEVTWHTRMTGTYRLFSKLERPAGKAVWRDAPSLKRIRQVIRG